MSDWRDEGGSFNKSRVVSRAFAAIGSNLPLYFGLSLILSGIPAFLMEWWQYGLRTEDREQATAQYLSSGFWLQFLAAMAVAVMTSAILQAAITRATATHLAGSKPSLVRCLETGLTLFVPMVVIGLVVGACVGIAAIFLVVPGVILWLYWSMALPAYVQERIGMFASLGRSGELTEGNRGNIFLIMLAVGVGMAVINWILSRMFGAAGSQVIDAVVQGLFATFNSAVTLTIIASIYVELRNVKDGVLPSELASIFA
jgi:hypothetical protein